MMRGILLSLVLSLLASGVCVGAPVFTDEQMKFLPSAIKYLTTPSPPAQRAQLPSAEELKTIRRNPMYGGQGEKEHLGGFTAYDPNGISNNTFNFMMGGLAIKSLVDVGCGKGVSTKFFHDQGVKVLCVEGSHDAVTHTLLPPDRVIEHDFSLGPWWPAETYDAAWSVEFTEHVGRQYLDNYLPIFQKSALIFVSGSGFGGHHHVEVS